MKWLYKIFDWRARKGAFNPNLFLGAGNVNHYRTSDPRKETLKLVQAGADAYHVEVFGWADTNSLRDPDGTIASLKEVVFWCKRRNLAFIPSVFNDNSHIGKYGNKPIFVRDHMLAVVKVMTALRKMMWKDMYVQPVGETQTPGGQQVEAEARKLFPKSNLVSNSSGGRPSSIPSWAAYAAVHMPHVADSAPGWSWEITDHGTRIREHGGIDSQDYNDAVLEKDANNAFKRGNPYVLYAFQQREMNESDLRACAKGYKK